MNKDLILAIEALEKENGISKEIMFDAIEKSLMDEYKAEFDKADNGRVSLDRITGDFHIYSDRTVVEKVEVPEFRENKKEKYVYLHICNFSGYCSTGSRSYRKSNKTRSDFSNHYNRNSSANIGFRTTHQELL